MSNAVYPVLPGITFDVKKTPQWKTLVQESVSGEEVRVALRIYPRWVYSLQYEFLRSAAAYAELQTLLGFFLDRKGSYDSFLFTDPDDYTITGQTIGTGDGSLKNWQMIRTYGGFTEPVLNVYGTSHIYLDAVEQMSGWTIGSTGVLTFTNAPANNKVITADFTYRWRVRFVDDELEFSKFMNQVWTAKKVEFITVIT